MEEQQFELLRGKVEELTGRLETMATQLKGLSDMGRWLSGQLHGRALELRGKGRQMMATSRLRAEELGEELPERASQLGPYAIIGAVLLGVAALAIVAPNVLTTAWDRITSMFERGRYEVEQRTTEMGGPQSSSAEMRPGR